MNKITTRKLSTNIFNISVLIFFFLAFAPIKTFSQDYSLDFDGDNDHVRFGFKTFGNISGNAARTYEVWVKTTATGVRTLIHTGGANSYQRFALRLYDGVVGVDISVGFHHFTTPVNDGNWHHIAVSYSGGTLANVVAYIDGVLDPSTGGNTQFTPDTISGQATLGVRGDFNAFHFGGQMDEVRIWNKARSQAEIQATMNTTLSGSVPNLVANYDFESNIGTTTLLDKTSNSNTGTLTFMDPANDWIAATPVITLTGANPQTINIPGAYSELNAIASDATDGDISNNIVIDASAVDVNTAGSYQVTYNVTDSDGNAATELIRTVDVVCTLDIQAVATNVSCLNSTDGSVVLTPSGGTAPYTYGQTVFDDNFSGVINLGNYSSTTMTTNSNGAELELTPTSGWTSDFLSNQTFTREAGLTFEGSVFIPYDGYKAVMVGFNDATGNGTSSVSHGVYFFDNGSSADVGINAIFGASASAFPTGSSYANTTSPGNWFDFKIVLDGTDGATYSVKKSTEATYTNTYTSNSGNLTTFKIGVNSNNGGSTATTLHKNWRVYRAPSATTNLAAGIHTFFVRDANGCSDDVTVQVATEVDSEDPVVTLNGASDVDINLGDTYNDPGATATDNCAVFGAIVTSGTINNAVVGAYTLTYTAKDEFLNAGTITRTVNVLDLTPPVISPVTIASNNPNNSALGKEGDVITLSFTSDEDINQPTVSIAGQSATVTGGPTVWSATITKAAGGDQGSAVFEISNISDTSPASNSATDVVATTDNSEVVIDTASPTIKKFRFSTDNNDDQKAKVGDVITLTFEISNYGPIDNLPTVTLAGNQATTTATNAGTQWESTITVTNAFPEGPVSAVVSAYEDAAGNVGETITTVSSVVIDRTAPVISSVTMLSNNANAAYAKSGDEITLSFTSDDTINTPTVTIAGQSASVSNTGNNWTATASVSILYPQGAATFNISNISDLAGNSISDISTLSSGSAIIIDTVAPIAIAQNPTVASDANGNATVTVADVDNGSNDANGVSSLSISHENVSCSGLALISTLTATDPAGNIGTTSYSVTITDNIKPVITLTIPSSIDIEVGNLYFQPFGGVTITDNCGGFFPILGGVGTVNSNIVGVYPITYDYTDAAGNAADQVTRFVNVVDTIDPTATAIAGPIEINLNGVTSITPQDVNDNSSDNYTQAQNLVLSLDKSSFTCADLGVNTVTLTVTDESNNSATATVVVNVIDDVAPMNVTLVNPAYVHPTGTGYVEQGITSDEVCLDRMEIVSSDLDANQWGTYTIVYKLVDTSGNESDPITRTQVVNNVPTTDAANYTVNQDTVDHIFDVLDGDSFGPDGAATFVISGAMSVEGGTLILNTNGSNNPENYTVTYSPRATYNGSDSFTYTIEDENGDSVTTTVNIIVRPIVPVPVDDTETVDKNSTDNVIDVLDNDDFGGNEAHSQWPLTFTNGSISSASAQGGTIVIENNAVTYSPAQDFVGEDTFMYTLTDTDGDGTNATVTITVVEGNISSKVPTAVADTANVSQDSEDNVIDVLDNDDFGLDGAIDGGLTMTNGSLISASAQGGAISIDNKGTEDTLDDEFNYSAPVGYTGVDTFMYTITDTSGDASTATVTVNVGITDTPTAVADTATAAEDSIDNVIDVLDNDNFGTDGAGATPITLSNGTTTEGGTVSLDLNNDVLYTPLASFTGEDTFTYTIEDGSGDTSSVTTVTVTVGVVVLPSSNPTAVADTAGVNQNSLGNIIDVLDNDDFGTDGENVTHPLTFKNGSLSNASLQGGTIVIENNTVTYSPAVDFVGEDTFEYVITDTSGDASTATVTVTVTAAGLVSVPTAVADTANVSQDSEDNVIDVLDNDDFGLDGAIDGGLTMTNGSLISASAQGGAISIDNKGTEDTLDDEFNYSAPVGYTGVDTFMYTITDTSGDASTATVTVNVGITDTPTAVADTATAAEDSIDNVIDVLDNDNFGTDGAGATPITLSNGTTTEGGTVSLDLNNDVLYTPLASFTGEDTFTYTIEDGSGDTSSVTTVTVTVGVVVLPSSNPTAVADTAGVNQNSLGNIIDVLDNDDFGTDGENVTHPLTFKNGSLSNASLQGGTIVIENNTVTYSPAVDFVGEDTFEYVITDTSGDASTATVTVTVTAAGLVSVPTAVADTANVSQDSEDNVIDVLDNDDFGLDGAIDGGLTMTNGSLTSASEQGGAISIDNKGTEDTLDDEFNYSAPAGYSGVDTFMYTITDASGDASTGTVTVNVSAVILGYTPDTATVYQDSSDNEIDVMANDTDDAGFAIDDVRFLIESVDHLTGTTANGGTVTLNTNSTPNDTSDDVINYTPRAGFHGEDTFNYVPGNDRNALVLVTVTVTEVIVVNGTPTAVDDTISIVRAPDLIVSIDVLDNDDFGTDGPNLTHSLTLRNGKTSEASAQGRTITVENGVIKYYASNNPSLTTDSFTYTITDASGDASTATVNISMTASKSAGVNFGNNTTILSNQFLTYPNPTKNGKVNIALNSSIETSARVLLFDVNGKVIYQSVRELQRGINTIDIDVNVKPGILFLKVISSEVNFGTKKVIFK